MPLVSKKETQSLLSQGYLKYTVMPRRIFHFAKIYCKAKHNAFLKFDLFSYSKTLKILNCLQIRSFGENYFLVTCVCHGKFEYTLGALLLHIFAHICTYLPLLLRFSIATIGYIDFNKSLLQNQKFYLEKWYEIPTLALL